MVEIIPGINVSLDQIVGFLVKAMLIMVTVLALIIVRQVSLMDKVVSVPVGGNFKTVAFIFFWVCLVMTGIVILVS